MHVSRLLAKTLSQLREGADGLIAATAAPSGPENRAEEVSSPRLAVQGAG